MMRLLFTMINLVMIAGAAYFGYGAYRMISTGPETVEPRGPGLVEKAAESNVRRASSPEQYRAILNRNLFNTKEKSPEKVAPAVPAAVKSMQPTTLQLKLWGTVTSGADAAYAIIEDKGKKDQNLYRVGDTVQKARVKEILREKVILTVEGRDEILAMERHVGSVKGGSARPVPRKKQPARPPSVRRIRLRRAQLEDALKNEENLAGQVKARPHFTDGRQDGIIMTGIKPNSIYRRMGLRNGDILMGVDEKDIGSVDDVSAVYQGLGSSSELTLKIKRRGRLTTMHYTIE